MATVPTLSMECKPKAHHGTFHGLSGLALRTADRRVFFVTPDSQWRELTNADAPWLVLNGECALADTQALADTVRGGGAWLCTHRAQEVA